VRKGRITANKNAQLRHRQRWAFFSPSACFRCHRKECATYTSAYVIPAGGICALHNGPCPVPFSLPRKPCSMAHRTPLSHTNRRNGRALRRIAEVGPIRRLCPKVRLSTSHAVRSGSPALLSVTRLRANAILNRAFGPFRDRPAIPARGREALRQGLHRARGLRLRSHQTFARTSPLYVEVFFRRRGRWSQHRVLGGNRHQRRHADTTIDGVRKSGLFP